MDTTAALNSMESTISDQEQEGNARNHPHPGKGKRMSNVGGRGKPGENRRPRPSGRQLIQERVQELRELVPNGTEVRFLGFCAFFSSDLIQVEQSTIGCSNNKAHDRCIAEQAVIRSLDLTIQKGVVESRSNNTRARILIETYIESANAHRLARVSIHWGSSGP